MLSVSPGRTQRGYTRPSPAFKHATAANKAFANFGERFAYLMAGKDQFQSAESLSIAVDGVHIGHHTWLNTAIWGGDGAKAWWAPPQAWSRQNVAKHNPLPRFVSFFLETRFRMTSAGPAPTFPLLATLSGSSSVNWRLYYHCTASTTSSHCPASVRCNRIPPKDPLKALDFEKE